MLSKGVWGDENKMTRKQAIIYKNKKNHVYAVVICELTFVLYTPITNLVKK